jgi:hypothetical protein
VSVILTIDGVKIGIASKGDPRTGLARRLNRLRDRDCSVIICATRTRGATVTAVTALQRDGYTIASQNQVWRKPPDRESGNQQMAARIVSQVERALN